MTHIVPNQYLPALDPESLAAGWRPAPEVIDDNMPGYEEGHGTGVACIAGATSDKMGVAPKTNLYLIKLYNHFIRDKDDGTIEGMRPAGQRASTWIDVFTRIYNAWIPTQQGGEGIPPHKSVINLSNSKLEGSDFCSSSSGSHVHRHADKPTRPWDHVSVSPHPGLSCCSRAVSCSAVETWFR